MENIPQDDILDVIEKTKALEKIIDSHLEDLELHLALSVIMNAAINSVLKQCVNMHEVETYKSIFIKFFNTSIKNLNINNSD